MNNYTNILLRGDISDSHCCAGSHDNSTAALLNGTQSGANDTSDIWKSRMREVPSNFTCWSNSYVIFRGVIRSSMANIVKEKRKDWSACMHQLYVSTLHYFPALSRWFLENQFCISVELRVGLIRRKPPLALFMASPRISSEKIGVTSGS